MLPALIKAIAKKVLYRAGYEIHRIENITTDVHDVIRPSATYSPWNKDEAFLKTYRTIRPHSGVDKYRCFELWSLVEQSRKLRGGVIEIGVWRGGTGALIAKKARLSGIDDTVYLCDTFTGVVKASGRDSTYRGGEHADTTRQRVERLLDGLGLTNVRILEGIFPDQTAHLIREGNFRFCHIDVDVYQSAKDIIDWIWPRMVVGGIIVYDDYGFINCDGITEHVEEQIPNPDRLMLYNLNGHAVFIKIR
jgi:O-methyltransferase